MTDDYKRPDPDLLLQQIKDMKSSSGKLKIFFGMAAGVGKTYAMLQTAQRLILDGIDIIVGYIESHGRRETEDLVNGLEVIPRKKINYRGVFVEELDIDAVIARRPKIVIVDELAHTNAEGSRHPKRYQDVLELIDAGISVFTTVNVQHLESRAETVKEITGITIQETVPDSLIERADEIELIDISPEELIKRLKEGKIYPPERAKLAEQHFFENGNLTALREMALRFTAEKVDQSLQNYRQEKMIQEPWKTGERLLVAVSHSPYSESLIRWTRRMAYNLGASWIAVNVERSKSLSLADQKRLQKNITLARELGAEIVVTQDEDVTNGILRIARQRNITQIVAGKPGSGSWKDIFRFKTPIKRLIKESGKIDLYIIRAEQNYEKNSKKPEHIQNKNEVKVKDYFIAIGTLIFVTIANYLALPYIGARSVSLILLLSVVIIALFVTRAQVFLYAGLSALIWNFLFLPPQFTFYIYHIDDLIMFGMYFIIAIIVGSLTTRIRNHEKFAVQREEQLNVLYNITKKFTSSITIDEAAQYILTYINSMFNALSVIYLKEENGTLSDTPHPVSTFIPVEKDYSVAHYSFTNKRISGKFTDTLPSSPFMFLPLYVNKENILGVIGIRFSEESIITIEQKSMLETISSHLALVIEREFFIQETQKIKINEESEKLYKVLLNSVTHELRTPLTAIKGLISTLMNLNTDNNEQTRNHLLSETQYATERLIQLVDNLLDMSRIESGKLVLNLDWNDISDIIDTTLSRVEKIQKNHTIALVCPEDIPLVRVDYTLISQAIYSIVHNALVHTDDNTPITISVSRIVKGISITIEDEGKGLLEKDIERIFDKFYRSSNNQTNSGLGLGLSISNGIIELHGGHITAENKKPTGAKFIIYLPVDIKEKEQ